MAQPKSDTAIRRTLQEEFEACRHDPVRFARSFLQIEPHQGQIDFMRKVADPDIREAVLSAANRWGKSDCASILLLWMAFYMIRPERYAKDPQGRTRPYIAINVSISIDQASIVFNKAAAYAQNSRLKTFVDSVVYSPFPTMTFKKMGGATSGAEIWARSTAHNGKYLLGHSFPYVNYDEAALEPNGDVILNDVIMMRLADAGGKITYTSQPRGKNWFYQRFLYGDPGSAVYDPTIHAQYGSSFDNPHINHEYIRRAMERMTESQIAQNIYGRFADEESFFPLDRIMACMKDQDYKLPIPPGHDVVTRDLANGTETRFVPTSDPKPQYVMGVDLAAKQDDTCIAVLRVDVRPWQLVHFELLGRTDWRLVKNKVAKIHKLYRAWGYTDYTGPGIPVTDDLRLEHGCDLEGYNFAGTTGNKLALLIELQMAIQNAEFRSPYIEELVNQLAHYQLEDKRLRTDAVFGLALAVKAARDAEERAGRPYITTPDLASVVVSYDRATGLPIVRQADDNEEDEDPTFLPRSLRHLAALI